MNYKYTGCSGCYSRDDIINACNSGLSLSRRNTCPCKLCIIKVMCIKGCEDFYEYKRQCNH